MRRLGNADSRQQLRISGDRLSLQPRVERERLGASHRRVQRDVLGQIAKFAPSARRRAAGGILAQNEHAARTWAHQPEHDLDQCGFAGAVVADQADALAGVERQIELAHGVLAPVAAADAPHDDHFFCHGANRSRAGGRGGVISGAESITPPGWIAGNRACAQRTICTAGLLRSILAAGARHMT